MASPEVHQKKRELRVRLNSTLRAVAALTRHPKNRQVLEDLANKVDGGTWDDLPVTPDGFTVKNTTVLRQKLGAGTLCHFQIVSMAVMYYRLYAATEDPQDARSCERYLDWISEYLKSPHEYRVVQTKHLELYLFKGKDEPHTPDWLKANGGETV